MCKCRLLIVIACCLVASAGARAAAEFAPLSRSLIEGPARSVAFFDSGVILGTGAGIAVFCGGDSLGSPAFLPLDGKPYDICVKGEAAYVAAFESGLVVIDLADPRAPVQVFSYRAPRAMHCAIGGDRLFVADDAKLLVFDIANPKAPVLETTTIVWKDDAIASMAADRDLLCLATKRLCVVYRVGRAAALEELMELRSEPGIEKVDLTAGVLCFLTPGGKLHWRDLVSPGRPVGGELREPKDIVDFGLTETGGMLLTQGLDIVPFAIGRICTPEGQSSTATFTLEKRIARFDAASYALAGETQNKPILVPHQSFGPSRPGGRFALVWPRGGLSLFSMEKNRPRHLGRFETSGLALNVIASRGIVYVANGADGIRIGEVRESGAVEWVGRIPMEDARDMALAGSNLVIANGAFGLVVAEVSNPRHPRIVGRNSPNKLLGAIADGFGGRFMKSDHYLSALVVRGGKAFCAGGMAGVEVFDLSDVGRPRVIWRDELSPESFEEVRGIDVDDRSIYISNGYQGFRIFSIDTERPVDVAALKMRGWNCGCTIAGNTLFLANGGAGVAAADVSDRASPKLLGSVSIGSIAREVFVLGKRLFVAGERAGVVAVDVSDPHALSIAARFKAADDARGVFADERFVYLANAEGGLYVFRYNE